MKPLFYILICAALMIASYCIFIYLSFRINTKWFKNPPLEGKLVDINGKKIFMRVKGEGDTIVVINAIGGSQAEWWSIQDALEQKFRIITYDRSGYGWSTQDDSPKTLEGICAELDSILNSEGVDKPVYLVSNGTGVIYSAYFALTRPEKVAGAVFINPPPLEYESWLENVNEKEDCSNIFELAQIKAKNAAKGVYRIFSPFKGYNPDKKYKKYIVEHYLRIENHKTVQAELAEFMSNISQLKNPDFPPIPLRILNTSIEFLIKEWVQNGASEYSARQLGRIFEEMSKDILSLSPHATMIEVSDTGENIHLYKPEIVINEILETANTQK